MPPKVALSVRRSGSQYNTWFLNVVFVANRGDTLVDLQRVMNLLFCAILEERRYGRFYARVIYFSMIVYSPTDDCAIHK